MCRMRSICRNMRMKPTLSLAGVVLLALIVYSVYSVYDSVLLHSNPHDATDWASSPMLPRSISRKEYDAYMDLLVSFLDHCRRARVTVVAWGGTLVGAYMFHDPVPWDDDMDFMIPYTDLPKLKRHFRDITNRRNHDIKSSSYPYWEMDLHTLMKFPLDVADSDLYRDSPTGSYHTGYSFKYFHSYPSDTGSRPWRWPYLDIVLYRENDTHVWTDNENNLYLKRDQFYPFVPRPFGRVWLNCPADTAHVLRRKYGDFVCKNHHVIHRHGQSYSWFLQKRVECSELWDVYPQVWSESGPGNIEVESLKLGTKVLHSFRMQYKTQLDQPSKRPFNF